MFYEVGKYRDWVFIYDSSDETCEMVEYQSLKESGVAYKKRGMQIANFSKIRMMYGFEKYWDVLYKPLLSYELEVEVPNWCAHIPLGLGIRIIPKEVLSSSNKISIHNCVILIQVNNYRSEFVPKEGMFRTIKSKYKVGYDGIVIPMEMLSYIMRLRENKDTAGFFSAFGGLLSYKLQFVYCDNVYSSDISSSPLNVNWSKFE